VGYHCRGTHSKELKRAGGGPPADTRRGTVRGTIGNREKEAGGQEPYCATHGEAAMQHNSGIAAGHRGAATEKNRTRKQDVVPGPNTTSGSKNKPTLHRYRSSVLVAYKHLCPQSHLLNRVGEAWVNQRSLIMWYVSMAASMFSLCMPTDTRISMC